MKERIIRFFKLWTLPLGMFAGVGIYLMFHYIPLLSPLKVLANGAEDYIMPFMIFVMLFTTFCKVNPREMRIRRWHVVMILFQLVCCLAVFAEQFALILRHVFPLLICPFLAAWALREFAPKAHALVVKFCGSLAFYLWGVSLVIAIGLTLRSVINSHFNPHVLVLLALSGLIVCAWQFGTGKLVGKHYNDYISCGQGNGQKNTLLAIWTAYTYLSPVISVAPSCYIVWQNIVNSWQLWAKGKRDAETAKREYSTRIINQ